MAACWLARIVGLLFALLFFAFVIGEGLPTRWNATLIAQFLALAGIACGLIVAWKWEGLGGAITLAAFCLLGVTNANFVTWARWSPFTVLPPAVGLLHVLCWLRLRGASPGKLPRAIWIAFGAFVLLCANEVFGNPPLMTPRRPAHAMVGTWRSANVVLTVDPDGLLAGTIDGKGLGAARVVGNRSWFGKLMKWRTDYTVRGDVNGFLWLAGARLNGQLQWNDGRRRRFEVVR